MTLDEILINAAHKVRALAQSKAYLAGLGTPSGGFRVSVSWSWGASNPGYPELREEVQALVEAELPMMLGRAKARLEAKANQATLDALKALESFD
jgi:hypothetical protein